MTTQIRKLDLAPETLANLEVRYKATRDRRVAERLLCVILKAKGHTHQEIAGILLVTLNTVSTWLHCYVTDGLEALCQIDAGGSTPQLTDAQLAELQTELDRRLFQTAAEVTEWVSKHFGLTYSERGMQALLQRLGFTFQKARLIPSKADPEAQAEFLKAYAALKASLKPTDRYYFTDAVHEVHNALPGYGWARSGQRRSVPSNSGRQRFNIVGAYSPQATEYVDLETTENITAQSILELVRKLEALHPEAERIVLIADNARYNHARVLREYLCGSRVEMMYLPPYSPNLNLIERLWKFMKKKIRRNRFYATFEQFVMAIRSFFASLSEYADELRTLLTENFEILTCG